MASEVKTEPTSLRIHGDNIIECERTLKLICAAFLGEPKNVASSPYLPAYEIKSSGKILFFVELFPGYRRWNVDLRNILTSLKAPVREEPDSFVTRLVRSEGAEYIIFATEFCSALPAGNQAWQRNGRALACSSVGIPYLYFAEIGGVELNGNREIKAPRFPNPIVTFSYVAATKSTGVVCLPVYRPSPSSTDLMRRKFESVLGYSGGIQLVRNLILGSPVDEPVQGLMQKAMSATKILAEMRRSIDTLRDHEWDEFLESASTSEKFTLLVNTKQVWASKKGKKVAVTSTFRKFFSFCQKLMPSSIGARDIPVCLLSPCARRKLANYAEELYGRALEPEFLKWIAGSGHPLVLVWVTGFKPGGDDSRPDRGLLPLARMVLGNGVEILTIVSGPAPRTSWKLLKDSHIKLVQQNGLWEAVINLSDAILADSRTSTQCPFGILLSRKSVNMQNNIHFSMAVPGGDYSEQDVDTVLHVLFAGQKPLGVFECMCNPPGGDWSGISILDFSTGEEFRWTSLPRVTGDDGKRPDHVVQFDSGNPVFLSIESKDQAGKLGTGIGQRLKRYVMDLFALPPIACKQMDGIWRECQGAKPDCSGFSYLSGGAFRWTDEHDLNKAINSGGIDIAFGLELRSAEETTLLHLKAVGKARILLGLIQKIASKFDGRLKIQIH
jgi:hypothetical protein